MSTPGKVSYAITYWLCVRDDKEIASVRALEPRLMQWLSDPGAHDHFYRMYEHCRSREVMNLEDVTVPTVYIQAQTHLSILSFQPVFTPDKHGETICGLVSFSESGVRLYTVDRVFGIGLNEWALKYSDFSRAATW